MRNMSELLESKIYHALTNHRVEFGWMNFPFVKIKKNNIFTRSTIHKENEQKPYQLYIYAVDKDNE